MAQIGEVIDDKYEILKLIGKGGMSRVYLAMDKRLNKQWAVKEIAKRVRDKNNEVVIQSAIAEANMIKKLDHPALPRIVDIIDNGDVICVVMDYIEGEPLNRIIESEGAQPEGSVIEWAKQLCEVLDYLHTRTPPIIYRDMKPANIMLKPDGTVKLIDFGIAREYKEHNVADTINMGTKGYAAPEQFGNAGQTDARTDVYCLGVTLYHLLTGHNPAEPPYEIYPIRHWDPSLSAGLEVIVQKCVQQNPEDRYQSCAELMYALQHYEEYGEEYRAAQRKKLRVFAVTAVTSLLCFGLGLSSLGMRTNVKNSDYKEQLDRAARENNIDNKIGYILKANEIMPIEKEPYLRLVEVFTDNASEEGQSFTTEEEKILQQCIVEHGEELQKEDPDAYARISYRIGMLYWVYYSYGGDSNEDVRQKAAVTWFDDVLTYGESSHVTDSNDKEDYDYKLAEIYKSIGSFNDEINRDFRESNDVSGKFEKQWKNINELLSKTTANDAPMVQLQTYRLIVNQIIVRAENFKNDKIEKDSMNSVLKDVYERLGDVNVSGIPEAQKIKEDIESKKEDAQKAINRAFKDDKKSDGKQVEK